LRQDFHLFHQRGVKIIALGPDGPIAFRRYWQEQAIPFTGCADVKSRVADRFHQEIKLLKFGRMPAIFVLDKNGCIRYRHYGESMSDIPANSEILKIIDELD
jgi:peroxiredoxin